MTWLRIFRPFRRQKTVQLRNHTLILNKTGYFAGAMGLFDLSGEDAGRLYIVRGQPRRTAANALSQDFLKIGGDMARAAHRADKEIASGNKAKA